MLSVTEVDITHWYDFICPFCYLAQPDNEALEREGVHLVELGFSAHPEIPLQGIHVGPRRGAIYVGIERLAAASSLPLHWPDRLPNTALALGAAEWIRVNAAPHAAAYRRVIFAAHFAEQADIGDPVVVAGRAEAIGVDRTALESGLADGSAARLRAHAEALGRTAGVTGTPAWLSGDRMIMGLQPDSLYDRLVGDHG